MIKFIKQALNLWRIRKSDNPYEKGIMRHLSVNPRHRPHVRAFHDGACSENNHNDGGPEMSKKVYYKAFDENMQCRGFQYKVGKTYKHEGAVSLCNSGFHACENPFDCWDYYDLTSSKFALVEAGKVEGGGDDSKIVTAEIHIKAELFLPEFIKSGVSYLMDLCGTTSSGNNAQQASSGDNAKQASSGYNAKQASSGFNAKQASSGNYAQQASSGNYAKQASSGDYAQQASSGYNAKQASSGSYAKQASSGNYAQQASSGNNAKQASIGNYAQQASSGNYAKQASSGNYAQQASSGDYAQQASSGDYAQQASSGNYAQHDCQGEYCIIASSGIGTVAKGVNGTWIALAEYDYKGKCVGFATGCIGQDGLQPDTFYKAEGGKLVEVKS